MKVIVINKSEGEYDEYSEYVDKVYIVEDDFPTLDSLYNSVYSPMMTKLYVEFQMEYFRTHPKYTQIYWNRHGGDKWSKYVTQNNLQFSQWLERTYNLIPAKFDAWLD